MNSPTLTYQQLTELTEQSIRKHRKDAAADNPNRFQQTLAIGAMQGALALWRDLAVALDSFSVDEYDRLWHRANSA
ncbi:MULTISPECIES: hypothetical protein [Burkholderia cepacia complex]|uniref:Uncharacterized protein n=1 Tax=Burkholderia pseudomultivorans TaxID=1207504 RepID=A0A132ENE5_9BURK|nr:MULTISPECIES: hypothetical protein [Burkholderia cepacia complex]KWF37427.1 hypothetical protein WT56_34370 [Burkholderia pseudomultivorans]